MEEKDEDSQQPKTQEDRLDDCIEKELGGFGKFQVFAYLSVSTGINSVGFWFYQMGYLMQKPKYACEMAPGVSADICTSELICAKDERILSWSIDWDGEASLHNWHLEYDLMCWPKESIGFFCALFWLGWCCTLLWVPRLGDIYGRKYLIAYNNFVSLALYLGTMFAPNIYILGMIMFTWGLFNSCRTNIAFLYMQELMPKK